MDIALMQTALNVLRAYTEFVAPVAEDIAALRTCLGPEALGMPADELARTTIERCLRNWRRLAAVSE